MTIVSNIALHPLKLCMAKKDNLDFVVVIIFQCKQISNLYVVHLNLILYVGYISIIKKKKLLQVEKKRMESLKIGPAASSLAFCLVIHSQDWTFKWAEMTTSTLPSPDLTLNSRQPPPAAFLTPLPPLGPLRSARCSFPGPRLDSYLPWNFSFVIIFSSSEPRSAASTIEMNLRS